MRREVPDPLAAASSFVDRKKISRTVAATPSAAVSPMPAIAVTVVTVVVDIVVIIALSYTFLRPDLRILTFKNSLVKTQSGYIKNILAK